MAKPPPSGKPPGPGPLTEKRERYLRLVNLGMDNSAACREVGVNRRTGTRWRYGRTVMDRGVERTYAPITDKPKELAPRFLSQEERVLIGDRLLAGGTIRSIASELGRSPSTISREVHRNRHPSTGAYQPFRAQVLAAGHFGAAW
jgi:transposase, IS30 family